MPYIISDSPPVGLRLGLSWAQWQGPVGLDSVVCTCASSHSNGSLIAEKDGSGFLFKMSATTWQNGKKIPESVRNEVSVSISC